MAPRRSAECLVGGTQMHHITRRDCVFAPFVIHHHELPTVTQGRSNADDVTTGSLNSDSPTDRRREFGIEGCEIHPIAPGSVGTGYFGEYPRKDILTRRPRPLTL